MQICDFLRKDLYDFVLMGQNNNALETIFEKNKNGLELRSKG